jgi:hypothetical protein
MKPSLFFAFSLLACAAGLGLTGLMISQADSRLASILPARLFYGGACIAFLSALVSLSAWTSKGD